MRIEYEYEIHLREYGQSHYAVNVREDHVLPCGEIESEYVKGLDFRNREDAEAKWRELGKKYEDLLRKKGGGIVDYQNWMDSTSELIEIDADPEP